MQANDLITPTPFPTPPIELPLKLCKNLFFSWENVLSTLIRWHMRKHKNQPDSEKKEVVKVPCDICGVLLQVWASVFMCSRVFFIPLILKFKYCSCIYICHLVWKKTPQGGLNKFKVKLLGIILVQSGSNFYTDVFSPNCIINATALFEFQKKSFNA